MSGVYTCNIWEASEGRESTVLSNPAVLYVVQKPEIISAPEFVYSKAREPFEIKINASGEDLEFQWYSIEKFTGDTTKLIDNKIISGVQSNHLNIKHGEVYSNQLAHFFCEIKNKCGNKKTDLINYHILPKRIFNRNLWSGDLSYPCEGSKRSIETSFIVSQLFWEVMLPYPKTIPNKEFNLVFLVNGQENKFSFDYKTIASSYTIEQGKSYEIEVRANFDNVLFDTVKTSIIHYPNPEILSKMEDIVINESSSNTFLVKYRTGLYSYQSLGKFLIDGNDKKLNKSNVIIKDVNIDLGIATSKIEILNLKPEHSGNYKVLIMPNNVSHCYGVDQRAFSNEFEINVLPNEEISLSVEDNKFDISLSPNPFYLQNKLEFNLEKASQVKIELFDARGMKVAILEDKYLQSGKHNYSIKSDKLNLSAGVYFYVVNIGDEVITKEIVKID
jgi:hypothetical protein